MNLFNIDKEYNNNLLPKDGLVLYFGKIFSEQESTIFLEYLLNFIEWKHDQLFMYGKNITTKRKMAFYGNNNIQYTYSKTAKQAMPWTKELLTIKQIVEQKTNDKYNSCLLNLYHNGNEGMGWHTDNEKEMKKHGSIASLSFGNERKFNFKHKETKEKITVVLENGSLLLMKGITQDYWLHQLPVSKKVLTPRINLTFRTIEN